MFRIPPIFNRLALLRSPTALPSIRLYSARQDLPARSPIETLTGTENDGAHQRTTSGDVFLEPVKNRGGRPKKPVTLTVKRRTRRPSKYDSGFEPEEKRSSESKKSIIGVEKKKKEEKKEPKEKRSSKSKKSVIGIKVEEKKELNEKKSSESKKSVTGVEEKKKKESKEKKSNKSKESDIGVEAEKKELGGQDGSESTSHVEGSEPALDIGVGSRLSKYERQKRENPNSVNFIPPRGTSGGWQDKGEGHLFTPKKTGFPEADRIAGIIRDGYGGMGRRGRKLGDIKRIHVVRKELCGTDKCSNYTCQD
jgi:hypothetical protein